MVYCVKCRHVFPEYKEIGEKIKDAAPHPFTTVLGPAVRVILDGPLAVLLDIQTWESALSFLELQKVRSGSRRDALNVARFPCPICREFIRWRRGDSDKGSVIRPGEPNWRGGSNRFLLD
jgi:hypothetical protein